MLLPRTGTRLLHLKFNPFPLAFSISIVGTKSRAPLKVFTAIPRICADCLCLRAMFPDQGQARDSIKVRDDSRNSCRLFTLKLEYQIPGTRSRDSTRKENALTIRARRTHT